MYLAITDDLGVRVQECQRVEIVKREDKEVFDSFSKSYGKPVSDDVVAIVRCMSDEKCINTILLHPTHKMDIWSEWKFHEYLKYLS